jgi:hypothetical protein
MVYLVAMRHVSLHGRLAAVLVEMTYVTLTAGIYAGLQQRALGLRSRMLGNLIVALGVPGFAQVLDWVAHHVSSAPTSGRAMVAVCIFASISALFHLHVMRNGVFLTGQGRSLLDDFRRIPRLLAEFVLSPIVFLAPLTSRPEPHAESEAAL